LSFLDLILEVAESQIPANDACVFALHYEPACPRLGSLSIPFADERSVATAISAIEESLDCLSEDFARDRVAQILEFVPPKTMKVVLRYTHWHKEDSRDPTRSRVCRVGAVTWRKNGGLGDS
jgi:hypothetical protein